MVLGGPFQLNYAMLFFFLPPPFPSSTCAPKVEPVNLLFAKQALVLDIHGLCLLKAVAAQATCQSPPALSPRCWGTGWLTLPLNSESPYGDCGHLRKSDETGNGQGAETAAALRVGHQLKAR